MESVATLSVVVCTYNRCKSLRETLIALKNQTFDRSLKWEIVVVDNNSSDQTKEIVLEFATETTIPVRYVFEKSQGLSFARNKGIAQCRGSIVAFTDDDITPECNWVQTIYDLLQQSCADGIGGKVLPKWPAPPPAWIQNNRGLLMFLSLLESDTAGRVENGNAIRVIGANMAFRRELFDDVGLFDVTLGRIGAKLYSHDETDFVMRAVQMGKNVIYDPKLIVWQRLEPSRMERGYFRKYKFDTGENRALRLGKVRGRTALGIPFSAFITTYTHTIGWLQALLRKDPQTFRKELDVWHGIGFMWGRFKTRHSQHA